MMTCFLLNTNFELSIHPLRLDIVYYMLPRSQEKKKMQEPARDRRDITMDLLPLWERDMFVLFVHVNSHDVMFLRFLD